jgi:hypothetical protein
MKRVTPQPILPREQGENWTNALLRLLREYSDAINQAADHRLSEFVAITADYTAGENDHVILVSPGGVVTITLPAASVMRNKRVIVKRANNTTHVVTIKATSGTIDETAAATGVTLTSAFQSREFFSDGAEWHLI